MDFRFSRRGLLQGAAAVGGVLAATAAAAGPIEKARQMRHPGWVFGRMTGAEALVEALMQEGTGCVYGIPGAQENELWDTFKDKGLPYLLVTHEYSAACMADGYARATGRPGVLCTVPGPGVTNSLTGLGEALLDSSPVVAIVGDVGIGEKAKPFQVHSLNQVELLKPVCKCVYPVQTVGQIPGDGAAGVRRGKVRRARPGRGRGAVQPVHRGARLPLSAARDSRAAVRRRGLREGTGVPQRPEGADRHLRRCRLHGVSGRTRRGRGTAPSARGDQRFGQGRDQRGAPARGRLGFRPARLRSRREGLRRRPASTRSGPASPRSSRSA